MRRTSPQCPEPKVRNIASIGFPTKVGTHFGRGYRPSPVKQGTGSSDEIQRISDPLGLERLITLNRQSGERERRGMAASLNSASRSNTLPGYAGAGMARWLYMSLRIWSRSSWVRVAGSTRRLVPVAMPRLTAGRLPTSSNQRLKYLNSSMSWPCAFQFDGPRVGDHVGDRVFVAGEIATVVEPVVQDAVEPVGLVGEAANGVGQVARLRAGAAEMAALAELRSLIGHLPDHPLGRLRICRANPAARSGLPSRRDTS